MRDNSILIETAGEVNCASVWIEPTEGHLDLHAWDEKTDNNEDPTVSLRLLENINGKDHPEWTYHNSADIRRRTSRR